MSKNCVVRSLAILINILTLFLMGMGVDSKTARLIDQEIQRHKAKIIRTRRFRHMNPELGNRDRQPDCFKAPLFRSRSQIRHSQNGCDGIVARSGARIDHWFEGRYGCPPDPGTDQFAIQISQSWCHARMRL